MGTIPSKHDLLIAEAIGVREALSWLKLLQVKEVVVESNSLNLIKSLCNNEKICSSVGLIINDGQSLK